MKFQRQFRRHSMGGSTYQKMDDGCAAGIDMRFGEWKKKNLESIPVRRLSNSNINNYSSNHKYARIQDSNRNLNVDGNNNNNKESFSKTKLERIFGTTLKKATAKATIAADFVNDAIITTTTKKRKPTRNGIRRRRRNSLSRSVATQATETLSSEFVIAIPTKIHCGKEAPIDNDDISVLSLDKALR